MMVPLWVRPPRAPGGREHVSHLQGGEPSDFVLKLKFVSRATILVCRSEVFGEPEDFTVKGYRADLPQA